MTGVAVVHVEPTERAGGGYIARCDFCGGRAVAAVYASAGAAFRQACVHYVTEHKPHVVARPS